MKKEHEMFSDPHIVGGVLGIIGILGLFLGLFATTAPKDTDWQEIVYFLPGTLMLVGGITVYIFG